MPANLPVSPNAATVQGASPDGATGYPIAVVPAAGAAPFDVNVLAGGGGAVTIADGADVCEGATTDAAVTSDSNGTISSKVRGLVKILADVWDSASHRLKVLVSSIVSANQTLGFGGMDITFLASLPYLYDRTGDLWRRQWGNTDVLLLASGSRATTQVLAGSEAFSPIGIERMGVIVYVAVAGTGTLTPSIQIFEPILGTYQTVWTAAAAIAGTGYFLYLFSDGAAAGGAWTEVLPFAIPGRQWQLTLTKSDGSNWTFGAAARYS